MFRNKYFRMKTKIALLSFIHSCNYGTLLQAFALAYKIKEMGCECEYLDFSKVRCNNKSLRRKLGGIKRKIINYFKPRGIDDYSFWNSRLFSSVKNLCDTFINDYIPVNSNFNLHNLNESNKYYSRFVVGSDQTWSPYLIKDNSPFLLKFVEDNGKKMSYAPSLGTLNVPTTFQDVLQESLQSFNILTCRERSNCSLLTRLASKDVNYVVDPTLLLSKDEWITISRPVEDMPEKYILCYILGEKNCISKYAEDLGIQENIPVYYILTRPYYKNKKNVLKSVGPKEFVYLISQASCVVTDSFHGTIFSINMGVPFYSFTKRENRMAVHDNDRIKEILKEFDLLERFCEDDSNPDGVNAFNYSNIHFHLKELREYSISILKEEVTL